MDVPISTIDTEYQPQWHAMQIIKVKAIRPKE